MTNKVNQKMINRFTGLTGKKRLIECIRRQQLIAGDASLAREFIKKGKLIHAKKGNIILQQGGSDNDLYLIITGSVSVSVNGREIAARNASVHFGEMALIDPTSCHSATITAKESCTLLCISEYKFSRIAENNPQLWRRMAVSLAARLLERNKFHFPPHSQPIIFIGSSSEALKPAQAIYRSFSKKPVISRLWTNDVFQASKATIEDLIIATRDSDFAIIVLSPDDVCISRGKKKQIPRDNAVFEVGLFMGALGRDRAFIVMPSNTDIKIPTDLLGVTCLQFEKGGIGTIGRRLRPVCRKLWNIINKLGPK